MKEPCIDCPYKNVDKWGYLCDIHCGKRSAWLNHQEGIREAVEWFRKQGYLVRKPDDDSPLGKKLKEWGIECK